MEFNFNCYFVGLYILCAKMKTFSYVPRKVHCSRNFFPSYPDHYLIARGGGGGGGTLHMRVVGMLVVSLRVVNFGFWSHLGCSGKKAIIFSREGLV